MRTIPIIVETIVKIIAKIAALGGLTIAGCGGASSPVPAANPALPTRAEYGRALSQSELANAELARDWMVAGKEALGSPAAIDPPYDESGVFLPWESRALGFAFDAVEDQRLQLDLDVGDESTGRLFVELFYRRSPEDNREPELVARFTDLKGGVLSLARSGRYVLRLQPELLAQIDFRVRLQVSAALEFPVTGRGRRDIGGVYGDPRDGGRRRHEGIDIFAPRDTPVVAVADGVAIPRSSRRGGNIVWVRGSNAAYYFAHLERAAIESRRRVSAGDVIGYVGNSGNAAGTPPHLHFGIYRRGRGSVDPLPYIFDREFPEPQDAPAYSAGYSAVTASSLNLRAGPGPAYPVRETLPRDSVLRVLGAAGRWRRVRRLAESDGWVHSDFLARPAPSSDVLQLPAATWLYDAPGDGLAAKAHLPAGTDVYEFARSAKWRLVGEKPNEPIGWLSDPLETATAGLEAASGP